jgi:hypothetical protein
MVVSALTVLTVKRHQYRATVPGTAEIRTTAQFGSFSFSGFTLGPALGNGTRVGVLPALHHTCIPTLSPPAHQFD